MSLLRRVVFFSGDCYFRDLLSLVKFYRYFRNFMVFRVDSLAEHSLPRRAFDQYFVIGNSQAAERQIFAITSHRGYRHQNRQNVSLMTIKHFNPWIQAHFCVKHE